MTAHKHNIKLRFLKRAPNLATLCVAGSAVIGVGCVAYSKPSLPDLDQLFSWSQNEKVLGFSHSADIVSTEPFRAGEHVAALPLAPEAVASKRKDIVYQYGKTSDGAVKKDNTIEDYMAHNKVTGLLILKDGKIVTERYAMGISDRTLWDSKSAGKSIVSTLMGAAIKDGYIKSLDDAVETYIPELIGTAYQGVTLRNMLRMASGVDWNENYLDPKSDVRPFIACTKGTPTCTLDYMKTLQRATDPKTGAPVVQGTVWRYSTGEASLSGLVVQRATGMSLSKYLERKIWQPYGMEADGNWWLEAPHGVGSGGGGFNATLRDYGRFAQFILRDGVLTDGTHVLPDNWIRDSMTRTAASAVPFIAPKGVYGFMWWMIPAYDDRFNNPAPLRTGIPAPPPPTTSAPQGGSPGSESGQTADVADWTFEADGAFGQMIAINQREKLVMVQWAVWDKPSPSCCDQRSPAYVANNPMLEYVVFLNAVIKALH